jgi:hypothetical protein
MHNSHRIAPSGVKESTKNEVGRQGAAKQLGTVGGKSINAKTHASRNVSSRRSSQQSRRNIKGLNSLFERIEGPSSSSAKLPVIPLSQRDHNDPSLGSRSFTDLFRPTGQNGVYNGFLRVHSPEYQTEESRLDYVWFKRSDTNMLLAVIIPIICILVYFSLPVFSAHSNTYKNNPTFLLTLLFGVLAGVIFIVSFFLRLAGLSHEYNITCMQRFHATAIKILNSPNYGQLIDDGLMLSVSLCGGCYVLSRALAGPCSVAGSVLPIQDCDPSADGNHSSLLGALFYALVIIPMAQIVARGGSSTAIFMAWMIAIGLINASIAITGYDGYLWINCLILLQTFTSYEMERLSMRHFVKSVRLIEAKDRSAKRELSIMNRGMVANDQELEAKRALVRHISHEIRTPLNIVSVGMCS